MYWAIGSGIEGNLAAYEAVVADLRKSRQLIDNFYLLGDIIAPTAESNRLVERIRQPRKGELTPLVCQGWYSQQILILHALGRTGEPTELIDRFGSIGRVPGLATYTLYHPGSNQVQFKTIRYGSKKGFG